MSYEVVASEDLEKFVLYCTRMTRVGWMPQGGISVAIATSMVSATTVVYSQAFIKEDTAE